jgi:hypothetical protein
MAVRMGQKTALTAEQIANNETQTGELVDPLEARFNYDLCALNGYTSCFSATCKITGTLHHYLTCNLVNDAKLASKYWTSVYGVIG